MSAIFGGGWRDLDEILQVDILLVLFLVFWARPLTGICHAKIIKRADLLGSHSQSSSQHRGDEIGLGSGI